MYLIINRVIVNKYTQNDHINSLLHQCHCNDLARIALAFARDAEPAKEISRNLGFTAVCTDGFSHGYVGESSSPQAPYVSTASGMHCQPSSEYFVYCYGILQLLQPHQQKSSLRKQFWDFAVKLQCYFILFIINEWQVYYYYYY